MLVLQNPVEIAMRASRMHKHLRVFVCHRPHCGSCSNFCGCQLSHVRLFEGRYWEYKYADGNIHGFVGEMASPVVFAYMPSHSASPSFSHLAPLVLALAFSQAVSHGEHALVGAARLLRGGRNPGTCTDRAQCLAFVPTILLRKSAITS